MTNLQEIIEVWEDIPQFENYYQISDIGNVKRYPTLIKSSRGTSNYQLHQGGLCHPTLEKSGYRAISLHKDGFHKRFRVHTLVGLKFVPNPNGFKEINHINGIKDDNRAINLEWCTRSHNNKHMYAIGLAKPMKYYGLTNDPSISTKVNQFDLAGNFIKEWPSLAEIYRVHSYYKNSILSCIKGKYKQSYGFLWKEAI